MARRGRGGLREGRNAEPSFVPTQAPVASPGTFVMPGTTMDLSRLDLSNLNIPMPAPQPIPQPAPAPYVAPAPAPYVAPAPLPDFSSIPKPSIPQPVPQPIPAPAPPPPPPPVEVAPPPPPIPQISPEVLAQIQQEFNIPAATVAPPPPVQVPPPVVQPEGIATLPQAPVEPPPAPVAQEFSLPPRQISEPVSQPAPVPEAVQPPPAPVAQEFSLPPRRISEPVSQPEPLAGPGMPTPSGGFLPGIDLNNLDLSGLAVPNQVQPSPEPAPAPFSPSEQMGSNYIEPRDGPGQVPPGRRAGVDDPTGIETMAEAVGQGDYLGIPLPDGSTFDLSTLDLSSIGGGPGFDPYAGVTGGLGPGGYGPEGGREGEQLQMGTLGGPVYDDAGNLIGNLGSAGPLFGEERGGEPVFNPPQGAIDEAQGTTYTGNNFTPDLSGIDVSNLDFSGLDLGDLNIGGEGGVGNNSYNPEDRGGPQGGPGRGNGPGNTMGGTDASGNGNTNTGSASTGGGEYDPQTGLNAYGMTPEQQAALDQWLADNPNGIDLGSLGGGYIDLTGVNSGGTGTTGTGDGSYTVDPVGPVGDLGTGDDVGSDPIDVTTPYVPPETRAASSYGLTGAVQTMPVAANPFRRPEAQQGIGSLAGGG